MKDKKNKDKTIEKNENQRSKKTEFNINEILLKILESRK